MNINDSTLIYDHCVGCGICAASCPMKAIEMKFSDEFYFRPRIDYSSCTQCGICSKHCPNSIENMLNMNRKVAEAPIFFGITGVKGYLAWSKAPGAARSASGGVTSEIIRSLFKNGMIDAVIHATMCQGYYNQAHFKATISYSYEEADSNRGSFYAPICFYDVLEELKKYNSFRVLVVGTPCVTRGIKKLLNDDKRYGIIICYTISLACSHNVNGMFSAYLADSLNIDRKQRWKINMRDKTNQINAMNYSISYLGGGNDNSLLIRKNRFESQFTTIWRSYAFSLNVCNACSDFWGSDSDVSIKDAWYKWGKEKISKNIVVVRAPLFDEILRSSDIHMERVDDEVLKECQKDTIRYKQIAAKKRLKKKPDKWNKIDLEHRYHHHISEYSKKSYRKMIEHGYEEELYRHIVLLEKIKNHSPVQIVKRAVAKVLAAAIR